MKINFTFKTLSVFLITVTICASIFFFIENTMDQVLFYVSIIVGCLLIRNSIHEEKNNQMIKSLLARATDLHFRLKELDNLKTEFVSLASHQLRAPLAKIQGYSSMILEGDFGKMPENLDEPIRRIFSSSQNLGSLLNDFLDVAHLEKGELRYQIQPCNLVDILNKTLKSFEDVLKNANLDLIISFDPEDEIKILGDPKKIFSALSKVVDNAIRYTPIGEVRVSIAKKDDDAIITIKDNGIGIQSNNIDELFQKFKRGDNAYNASVTGSGLGLYVAREMIEALEGRIWLKSEGAGKGTTVFIAFPLLKN